MRICSGNITIVFISPNAIAIIPIYKSSFLFLLITLRDIVCCSLGMDWLFNNNYRDIPRCKFNTGHRIFQLTTSTQLFNVLYTTLSNNSVLTSYWHMFVGVLGWLDTPLGSDVYVLYAVLLFIFAAISFQRTTTCLVNWRHIFLFVVTLASVFLLFIMMLACLDNTSFTCC